MKKIFKRNNRHSKSYVFLFFFVLISITIGYAVINTTLNINGNSKLSKNSWNIHFENIAVTPDSLVSKTTKVIQRASIIDDTSISFDVLLAKPGDMYEFTVDIVNNGSIDAVLSEVNISGLPEAVGNYFKSSVTYNYNQNIKKGDLLKAGQKDTLRILVACEDDITASDLLSDNLDLNISINLKYVQDDGTGVSRPKACKRATTLHTGSSTYTGGNTVEFGQLGTKGTLAVGDAFDCDVNGDGTYDAETERFYYVTNLNSNTAILIYYNNTDSKGANASAETTYYTNSYSGPITAETYLPPTSLWSKVGLINKKRQIISDNGDNFLKIQTGADSYIHYKLPIYNYKSAARLLTYDEYKSVFYMKIQTTQMALPKDIGLRLRSI